MASDEFLARIDEHMARGNELMREIRAEFELNRRTYEDGLQITREVIRRNELAFQENSRILGELLDVVRELAEDTRAHTQAIFRMLDRFDGGAEPAGA